MSGKIVKCGLCRFGFEYGAHVCQGCRGRIIYGATNEETEDAFKIGLIFSAILTLMAINFLPSLINDAIGTSISARFGMSYIYMFGIAGVVGLLAGGLLVISTTSSKKHLVRTFR